MTRKLLFIQGAGAGTHEEWDNKLVASLTQALGPTYDIRYPKMPDEGDPVLSDWTEAVADECAQLGDGAVLVGHSFGGAALLRAMAAGSLSRYVAGIFLIAPPFIGPGGWAIGDSPARGALGSALPAGTPIHLYYGSDDDTVPAGHVDLYADAIPGLVVHRLKGRDHQLNDDLSEVAADIRALP